MPRPKGAKNKKTLAAQENQTGEETDTESFVEDSEDYGRTLYLVTGTVRLVPLVAGRGGAQSEQTRLVWAISDDEASQKFEAYFAGLNTWQDSFQVINMTLTEAID